MPTATGRGRERTVAWRRGARVALELAEYAGERADEGGVTKGELEEYVPRWIAGPGDRLDSSEIVERMISSGMLVKSCTLRRETQCLPAENYREIAERNPPWQPGYV